MRRSLSVLKLLRDERGATAIEYGLILAMIAIAMIVAMQGLAGEIAETWNGVDTTVEDALGN